MPLCQFSATFRPPALVLIAAFIAAIASGCSLTLDLTQCESDADCQDGFICSADHLCEPASDGHRCDDDSDCEHLGEGWSCSGDGECQSLQCDDDSDCIGQMECNELGYCQQPSDLLVAPCDQGVGDLDDDDAFLIGVLLPLSGAEAGFGQPLFNAINLAKMDFDSLGLGSVAGRNIALLACDTQGDDALALQGAEHLRDVGVQAVIGPDYSSQTIDVATNVTIANEMVLVSPSATAAEISGLHDDYVWRTVASDTVQGQALGQLVNYALEERPHYDGVHPDLIPDESSVALLRRRDDPYALGLREAITDQLPPDIIGSEERLIVRAYANEAAGDPPDYAEVAADLIATAADDGFGPDVIVVIGASEAWTLADFLHDEFDNPPLFVFADAARNTERAAEASDDLRGRVWGTAPQNVGDRDYTPYNTFRFRYQDEFQQDPRDLQFVANAFDALYIIALGAAFDGGGFTGFQIAAGMHQLSDPDGQSFHPSASQAQQALQALGAGHSINFRGASGELNFDHRGDPSTNPIVLWCFDDVGLPEAGILLDEDLQFQPLSCGEDEPFLECAEHDDCATGQCCHPDAGTCHDNEELPGLDENCVPRDPCVDDADCINDENCNEDGYCVDEGFSED